MNKTTNGKGNNESRDSWETPQWLFDKLDQQYFFKFDCCATKHNKKVEHFTNNLSLKTSCGFGLCWMNPPFSKSYEMFKIFFSIVTKGIAIYRCDNMETKVWQDIILKKATWIFIPKGRISYEGMKGKGSRFPSALIGFNVDPPQDIEGIILYTQK